MKAIILNYFDGSVAVCDIPASVPYDSASIEDYLQDELKYKLSEISYMTISNKPVPVYYNGSNEPKMTL